jgi:hypothetical protein
MMTAPGARKLIDDFKTNTWLIHHLVDGVSDEASLRRPNFAANSLNWILGHILWRRNSVLSALDLAPLWGESTASTYQTGSEPLDNPDDARHFSLLLADLDRSQGAIETALQDAAEEALDRIVENDRGSKPVGEHLEGFHWHETYHIGQLEVLRAFVDFVP